MIHDKRALAKLNRARGEQCRRAASPGRVREDVPRPMRDVFHRPPPRRRAGGLGGDRGRRVESDAPPRVTEKILRICESCDRLDFGSLRRLKSHPVRVARFDKQTLTLPAHVTRVFYNANVVMQLALCALHTRRGPSRIITGDSVAKKAGTVKMSAARTARARLRNRAP